METRTGGLVHESLGSFQPRTQVPDLPTKKTLSRLRENALDHLAKHVRQAEVAAGVAVSQLRMIEPQRV